MFYVIIINEKISLTDPRSVKLSGPYNTKNKAITFVVNNMILQELVDDDINVAIVEKILNDQEIYSCKNEKNSLIYQIKSK